MTQAASIASCAGDQSPQTCRHHWVIPPANGPFSQGVCQTCGEVREFKNYVEAPSWDDWGLITVSRAEGLAVSAKSVAIYTEDHGEE